MRLTTKVKDKNGSPVNYSLFKLQGEALAGIRTRVTLYVNGALIGEMTYSIQRNHLYIHRIDNYALGTYKYVGKTLFEYAFHKSIKAGKNGLILLDATEAAPAAFFSLGMRQMTTACLWLNRKIGDYVTCQSETLLKEIQSSDSYNELIKVAAERLNKEPNKVTFDEAIVEGLYSPANDSFGKFLADSKLADKKYNITKSDCMKYRMHGTMYLPKHIIKELKTTFGQFIPIGSRVFFSQAYAKDKLQNEKIKKLVTENKLDSSNAIEIEAKMSPSDPRLDIILSPISLKMIKKNYVSGWFIGVYFNATCCSAILSANGLKMFEQGHIKNIEHLLNLGPTTLTLLFSDQGCRALSQRKIKISESGYVVRSCDDTILSLEELDSLLTSEAAPALSSNASLRK